MLTACICCGYTPGRMPTAKICVASNVIPITSDA